MIKLEATGIPENIEQYQLALDAAFATGKAVGLASVQQWLPIETAPKDGTEIILCSKVIDDMGICYWRDDKVMVGWTWGLGKAFMNPSHWMPRPAAPIEAISRVEFHTESAPLESATSTR